MCEPAYAAWCRQQGVAAHGVQPAYVQQGWRGVVATRPLSPGDVVMEVPKHLLLSVLSARRDAALAAELQRHQLSSHQVLAVHLLHQAAQGAASPWAPYIRQLPQNYTTLAAWPAAAVDALRLPHAQEAAAAAAAKARADWAAARPVLQALGLARKWCGWQAWLWASGTILSRTMFHPGDAQGCGCLTPLADLHNYAPPPPPHTPDLGHDMRQLLSQLQLQLQQQQHQQQQHAAVVWDDSHRAQQQQEGDAAEQQSQEQVLKHQQLARDTRAAAAAGHAGRACDGKAGAGDAEGCIANGSPGLLDSELPPTGQQEHEAVASMAEPAAGATAATNTPDDTAVPAAAAAGAGAAEAPAAAEECCISGDGHFDEGVGVYKIVARRSYQPGEQVFLCYGRHTNLELLELYGFMLADNAHDTAVLPQELLQQQLQCTLEQQLQHRGQQQLAGGTDGSWRQQQQQQQRDVQWRAVQLNVAAADCWLHPSGQPSWQLLSALRLAAASPQEARTLGHRALAGEPISLSSELLVLRALSAACSLLLAELGPPAAAARDTGALGQRRPAAGVAEAAAEQLRCMLLATSSAAGDGLIDAHAALSALQPHAHAPNGQADEQLLRKQPHQASPQEREAQCIDLARSWLQAQEACVAACAGRCKAALQAAAAAGCVT